MVYNYNLSFIEAVTQCLEGKGFIRGNNFKKGVYLAEIDGVIAVIDGNKMHKVLYDLTIGKGILKQKLKYYYSILYLLIFPNNTHFCQVLLL